MKALPEVSAVVVQWPHANHMLESESLTIETEALTNFFLLPVSPVFGIPRFFVF